MLCVDGIGVSHVVCALLVLNDGKVSLKDMINHIKDRNSQWTDVKTVITNKDMTERAVLKQNCLPSMNLQICLYHTLRTFL